MLSVPLSKSATSGNLPEMLRQWCSWGRCMYKLLCCYIVGFTPNKFRE
uniref:MOCS3-2 n=1 Tax=Arundo donax TaxID=35708 RepID=A0A0A9EGI8_ARUDO